MSAPQAAGSAPRAPARLIPGVRLPSGTITPGRRGVRSLRLRNAVVASSFELDGMRVLDVGCAEGRQSLYMAARAAEVWGVDHRMSEIEMARATASALGIKNVRFEAGDVRDPDLFREIGKFDLAIAWGFLHRITDIFALFYALEPITNAISLEWRTPVVPLMAELSMAYHPTKAAVLDPMNTGRKAELSDRGQITDKDKVEGNSAFWEPTPGAVKAMLGRLGYIHHTLIGYDEDLRSQDAIMARWREHETGVKRGRRSATNLPEARVHMLFEKQAGSIRLVPPDVARSRIPSWDHALIEHKHEVESAPPPRSARGFAGKAVAVAKGAARRLLGKRRPEPEQQSGKRRKRRRGYDEEKLKAEILRQALSVAADAAAGPASPALAQAGEGSIQISEIDFSKLSVVTYRSRQLARYIERNEELPRAVFHDDRYFYKIWRRDYTGHRRVALGTEIVTVPAIDAEGVERLWGFHTGLFDHELCPAYVGGIYNGSKLVGYRTLAGTPVTRFPQWQPKYRRFLNRLAKNTWRSGFAHSDFKARNLIRLPNGQLSLIDFDGQLRTLYNFAPEVEHRRGALRRFIVHGYRELLIRFADPAETDPEIVRTREAARSVPALLAEALASAARDHRVA